MQKSSDALSWARSLLNQNIMPSNHNVLLPQAVNPVPNLDGLNLPYLDVMLSDSSLL
jgi:hypothetical protein